MFYSKQISLKLFIILWTYPALIYSIGDISGIVLNQEGKPVNAIVIIYDYKTANKLVKIDQIFTNSRGEFEYKNLKNGSYKISIINSNYDIYNKKFRINGKILNKDKIILDIKLNPNTLISQRKSFPLSTKQFLGYSVMIIVFFSLWFNYVKKKLPRERKRKRIEEEVKRKRIEEEVKRHNKRVKENEKIKIVEEKRLAKKRIEDEARKAEEKNRLEIEKEKCEKERRDKWSNELGEEWKKSKYAKLKVPELIEELSKRSWIVIYKPYNKKEYVIALLDDDANNPESPKLRTKVIKQRNKEEKRKKEIRSKAAKKAAATRKANKKQRERDAKKAAATRRANKIKREREEVKLIDNSLCMGSGFLISNQGLVVTAYHVIENAKIIFIRFPLLELEFRGKVFLVDRNNDIAILKIPKTELVKEYKDDIPLGHFKSVNARVGENVITFGYPFGEILGNYPKLTDGRISDTSGMNDNPTHYQITNPIQPGNSGGPLINKAGNLIGIIVSRMNDQFAVEISGAVPQNVSFAVKVEYLSQALQSKNIKVPVLKSTQVQQDDLPTEVIAEKIMPLVTQIRLPKEDL